MCGTFYDHKKHSAVFSETELTLRMHFYCKKRPVVLKEIYQTSAIGIVTFSNSFLSDLTIETLDLIIPTGIASFWHNWHAWYEYLRFIDKEEPKKPQVLAIRDLSFGFIIWLIACGFCTICFLLELLNHYTRIGFQNCFCWLIICMLHCKN
jgi:hypothetical protein